MKNFFEATSVQAVLMFPGELHYLCFITELVQSGKRFCLYVKYLSFAQKKPPQFFDLFDCRWRLNLSRGCILKSFNIKKAIQKDHVVNWKWFINHRMLTFNNAETSVNHICNFHNFKDSYVISGKRLIVHLRPSGWKSLLSWGDRVST